MNPRKTPQPEFSMQAFQSGHQAAFAYVFRMHHAGLCFFANRLVQHSATAEDIVQETFVKLWEKHSMFENLQRIKAFLYITTRNACFNFQKRVQSTTRKHNAWAYTWTEEHHEHILNLVTTSELVNELALAISSLPKECRKIVHHSYVDGLSNQEIAAKLKISVHTVKNQKARATFLMKKRFGNKPLLLIALVLLEMRSNPLPALDNDSQQAATPGIISLQPHHSAGATGS